WPGPDAYTSKAIVDATNAKAGLIWQWGTLDFAGGTVVHINAAMAGLVGAYMVGKRIGYGREAFTPHSLTLTMVGAALLWVGWFAGEAAKPENCSSASQVWAQGTAVLVTIAWSGIVSLIPYKLVDMTIGLRVSEEDEREGLDMAAHGETAYHS